MWLLCNTIFSMMEEAHKNGFVPSAEHQEDLELRASIGAERVLAIAGDQAEINISGVLTPSPDIFAILFGGGNTTYAEINAGIAEAEANPDVSEIVFRIDSGGGTIAGMFQTMDAIKNASKPTKAILSNLTASAAYSLASQADTIEAEHRSTRIGSVGVVQQFFVDAEVVEVTSKNAPNKRHDVTTEEGMAAAQKELDDIHVMMAEGIAEGRKTTVKKVNADFGKGGMLLAAEALENGMIDAIAGTQTQTTQASSNSASGEQSEELSDMDIEKLKAEHPQLFADVVAVGTDAERSRVSAHIKAGTRTGAIEVAHAAIADGKDFSDADTQAEYLTAGIAKAATVATEKDESETEAVTGGADAPEAPVAKTDEEKAAMAIAEAVSSSMHSAGDLK